MDLSVNSSWRSANQRWLEHIWGAYYSHYKTVLQSLYWSDVPPHCLFIFFLNLIPQLENKMATRISTSNSVASPVINAGVGFRYSRLALRKIFFFFFETANFFVFRSTITKDSSGLKGFCNLWYREDFIALEILCVFLNCLSYSLLGLFNTGFHVVAATVSAALAD